MQIIGRGTYSVVSDGAKELVLLDDEDNRCFSLHQHSHTFCMYPTHQGEQVTKDIRGRYRVYHVMGERAFTNGYHLELQHSCNGWQAYFSPKLPQTDADHVPLQPIAEQVTKTSHCSCITL